jgi:hypothetical protein
MSELQTREQMLGQLDIVNRLHRLRGNSLHPAFTIYSEAADEITRLRQLLSEADKREREAKRIAVNAETYGYGHGLEAAAQLAKKMQDNALTDSAREHAGHFEEAIRALQSEER